jgi:hypothetical protein
MNKPRVIAFVVRQASIRRKSCPTKVRPDRNVVINRERGLSKMKQANNAPMAAHCSSEFTIGGA